MEAQTQIEEGLTRIRRRRELLWLLFFTFLPGTVLVGNLLVRATGWAGGSSAVGYLWMAAIGACIWRVGATRCPQCGERFHETPVLVNPWARRCMHCGLPLRPPRVAV